MNKALQPLGSLRKPEGARSVFLIMKIGSKFHVRRWEIAADETVGHPKEHCGSVDTLEEAHSYVTPGMECWKKPYPEAENVLEVWG